ncbi:MAG: sensor histidine kinase, partial [Planctomycetota bacterium]
RGEVDLQQARRRIQRQQHQAELAHLARVNTMGEMASGMAHELNQPLTAIVGYAEAALAGFESGMLTGEENRLLLEKIVSESQRAAEIIRRLRRLVRKRQPEQSPTDVNALIHEVVEMVGHESEQGQHDVRLQLDEDIPTTFADRVQIQQVLINLVRNGMEAMEPVPVDARILTVRSTVQTDIVHVSVSDTGPWVADDDLGKLFEPYFSTKQSGLGMGLAICRSIIEAHAGTLTASRNSDCGLNFEFTLPVREVRND